MGVCSSTSAFTAVPNRIVPPSSVGSSKYGPYRKEGGRYVLSLASPDMPRSFEKESELRQWLLNHITVKDKKKERVVRAPGTVAGAQFIISDCEDCDIYVLDHTSTVSVDRCVNCRIFVGPCDSSVFLRECNGCKFVIATRQLRTRNCKDNDLLLYCGTEPVIEKTKQLRLGCYRGSYFELEKHFELCALSPFHNRWHDVHDFTPGNGSGSGTNYSLLQEGTTGNDLGMPSLEELVDWSGTTVPLTRSQHAPSKKIQYLVTFAPTIRGMEVGSKVLRTASQQGVLVDCKHQAMYEGAYATLPSRDEETTPSTLKSFRAASVVRPGVDGTTATKEPKTLAAVVEVDGLSSLKMLASDWSSLSSADWSTYGVSAGGASWLERWKMEV